MRSESRQSGFSDKMQQIIDKFDYRNTIGLMAKYGRLAPIIGQYMNLTLGPKALSPLEMGYVYEELLRRFSEQSGKEAGEHFTPREVIRLMVELLDIPISMKHISIYDPACGTGGMLSVAKECLRNKAKSDAERRKVEDSFVEDSIQNSWSRGRFCRMRSQAITGRVGRCWPIRRPKCRS